MRALRNWNKAIVEEGIEFEVKLPSDRFFRRQGIYANHNFDMDGNLISQEAFDSLLKESLPTEDDRAYVRSLMKPVLEPGQIANWICPPKRGINKQNFDFQYVRTDS